ncbi:MAG TPA: cupin domain-containing protein [Thermoflexales bacterium]|nr:cupin domain-containing protein [Thermoflexales bacterium]HQW35886.1 cupin domain-containing protein [Thermoflexales bacterium]HQZ21156.1 cupin domain-containing protein [Thermoflexales bacterium]HRA00700.1 cupin domain-containing protein [Thermoflexales bacterium]
MTNTVHTLTDLVQYQPNSVVSKTVINKKAGTFTLFAFAQGEGLSEHTAPYDAPLIALDGEAEVMLGGTAYHLSTGQMLVLPAGVTHAVKAITNFKMALVMIRDHAAA